MATNVPITGGTPITIKISYGETVKKLKLPLKDLTAEVLPAKLTALLALPANKKVTFERFSDSVGGYITLEPGNSAVYKTLVRAAKAKLKLRLRASVDGMENTQVPAPAIQKLGAPVISSAAPVAGPASDRKNIGAGIFEFKDSRSVGQQKLKDFRASRMSEAPVPRPFSMPKPVLSEKLSLRPKSQIEGFPISGPTWSVYCNECDTVMHNEHYHCSICDGGDYDLCQGCVNSGKLCPGQGHWLVKRFIKDGQMISSTTERLPPKVRSKPASVAAPKKIHPLESLLNGLPDSKSSPHTSYTSFAPVAPIPGAFNDDAKTLREESIIPTRTCNCCVDVLPEHMFVTCKDCEDYDLCLKCHTANKHGHHPGHSFTAAASTRVLSAHQSALAAPGRNVRHYAICDGCDKPISGVRHKCFDCPDFDYCNDCRRSAHLTHAGHRFAPLYEQIATVNKPIVKHHGIYCDGPACSSNPRQSYIQGVRYKCAVCHDRDYCAGCEASPNNPHDKSHPLLKIASPIRGLEVTTMDDVRGQMSFAPTTRKQTVSPPKAAAPASSASSVKTVAHIEPTPSLPNPMEITKIEDIKQSAVQAADDLQANFVNDTIPDGIIVRADTRFTQVWTMRNPGPTSWPAGCSVRFIGGDNMLNVDRESPFSASAMAEATESNVIGREVKPGEDVAFKVVMKAPNRSGKAISYWRLKTAEGIPFGHRLWCDINVRMPFDNPPVPRGSLNDTAIASMQRAQELAARHSERLREFRSRQQELLARNLKINSELKFNDHASARQAYFQRKVQEMNMAGKELAAQGSVRAGPSTEVKTPEPAVAEPEVKKPATAEPKIEPATVEEPKSAPKLSESQMVFPTLDKESPASSIHQSMSSGKGKAATVEDEETGAITSAEKPSAAPSEISTAVESAQENQEDDEEEEEDEIFEDISSEIEVLSASDSISDDDGFLTDEEYDILDASDEETIASN
ncbi:hypothetical protein C1H76_4572 [Elsinoe australis]|uniref:ZZ-type domain-containing protein n=1 Tax=Elsinoe australis TaxID=40998 RepID=A0A4V6DX63_9PEZI|nr:hypothetical protein C1H76_4572 [Elsinoe australis]